MAESTNPRETLWHLVKGIHFAMITYRHADGSLRACPMTMANRGGQEERVHFYFLLSRDSDLARCVTNDGHIQISFADPGADSYVSVSSYASLSEDRVLKETLWNTAAKAWFTDGVEDVKLAVLVAPVTSAEYWDAQDNKLVQLYRKAKAAVTGEESVGKGEHQTLRL